jgi:hypothetical protein
MLALELCASKELFAFKHSTDAAAMTLFVTPEHALQEHMVNMYVVGSCTCHPSTGIIGHSP